MEIQRFLDELAAPTPTPGGGSASALAGALSASLLAMVAGLSMKKGKIPRALARQIQRKALAIQKQLLRAVEDDARSYEGVMAALRLPKDTERQKERRLQRLERALQKATKPPTIVCEASIELLEHSRVLLSGGNPSAWSDTAVAALLAHAAMEGGFFNIQINLESIKDKAFSDRMNRQIRQLKDRAERIVARMPRVWSFRK